MLNRIIAFSINNKLIVGLLILALIGYGSYEVTQLPIDAVPDITNNQVQVITVAPSFGATDIERLVTFPIEQANSNIDGIKEIRSFSRFGLSLVTIVFKDEIDVFWARQQVLERLQTVQSDIPAGIGKPVLGPVSTGLGEIYQYVIRPKKGYEQKFDAIELRSVQDWIVRRQLLGVEGVAEVSSFGGKLKQYEIAVDQARLQAHGLDINDVFNAIESNNQNTGGAYIEKGPTVLFVRSEGLITGKEDIEQIVVPTGNGKAKIFIRDIAEVKIGYATRYGALCYNDEGEVAGAVVMMLKGANSSKVIKNVKERIEQIKKTLPEGLEIEPFLDRTKMVDSAIGTVEKNLLEGALIVIFILVVFLGNLRAGLVVASVIPLAMLFAIILMNTFGVSGNLMSLGALDFGLIVDGAVIIVEAVMHQLRHSKVFGSKMYISQDQMNEQVKNSAGKMMNSAVFGQVIILIVYLPILTLQGIEGKMFKPMAQTVAFALLGAFILSLTYIPMMTSLVLSKKRMDTENWSDRMMNRVTKSYSRILVSVLRFPKLVLGSALVVFAIAMIVLSRLGGEFIPALEEGDFAVDTRVLTGSNLNTTIDAVKQASHILKSRFPEVIKVVAKIGSGEVPTDPMPMEACDLMVILTPKATWKSAKTFDQLAEKMTEALSEVPGITVGFQYPVQMRFNELMTGARQDVVCKIFGENLDTLAAYAQKLGKIAGLVDGSEGLYVEPITGMPEILVTYNRAAIASFGLNIADINRVVNTAFAGQNAGVVFEGEKRFNMVVRLQDDKRNNLQDVQNMLIPLPHGGQIPLEQVANVEIKDGPNQIQREDAKRRIVVGFNVRGRDVQSIVNELRTRVETEIKWPAGYFITYGGSFENLKMAKQRLMVAVPVSLLLIFVLLFFAFKSVKHGLLIYTAIPLSAIGGVFFLALRGLPFSISAGIGFIALFGVAVLNGIVLIAEFNRLKLAGLSSLYEIVIEGTKTRLRPVLMTAFVASFGFLPMALSNGAGAEVQRPLATVVIGGLLVATLLTLFVLPVMYILFENMKKGKGSRPNALVVTLFFVLGCNQAFAQNTIDRKAAIEIAINNNMALKNQQLMVAYADKLRQTAFDAPGLDIIGELGQINSVYLDKRLAIGQGFNMPTVYKRNKSLLNAEWNTEVLNLKLEEAVLRKSVSEVYNWYVVLYKQKLLLLNADSLYASWAQMADLRLKIGSANTLESVVAQTQRGEAQMQLLSVEQELELLELRFNLLLNAGQLYVPDVSEVRMNAAVEAQLLQNTSIMANIANQKAISAAAQKNLERAKLLPTINFNYNLMSMQGNGADNVNYGKQMQFQAVQLGLSIPVFYRAHRARNSAAQIKVELAQNQANQVGEQVKIEQANAVLVYQMQLEKLKYYENVALPNAELILTTANNQLRAGEINYMEFAALANKAIALKNAHLETLKAYNESLIQLEFLHTN